MEVLLSEDDKAFQHWLGENLVLLLKDSEQRRYLDIIAVVNLERAFHAGLVRGRARGEEL